MTLRWLKLRAGMEPGRALAHGLQRHLHNSKHENSSHDLAAPHHACGPHNNRCRAPSHTAPVPPRDVLHVSKFEILSRMVCKGWGRRVGHWPGVLRCPPYLIPPLLWQSPPPLAPPSFARIPPPYCTLRLSAAACSMDFTARAPTNSSAALAMARTAAVEWEGAGDPGKEEGGATAQAGQEHAC